jgi:hypothetical protein
VLASTPREFRYSGGIAKTPAQFAPRTSHTLTNNELRIEASAISVPRKELDRIDLQLADLPEKVREADHVSLLPLNCYDAASSNCERLEHQKPVPLLLPITFVDGQYHWVHFRGALDRFAQNYADQIESRRVGSHFNIDAYSHFWRL